MASFRERFLDLKSAVNEFIQDWRKGDFELPSLAKCDARAMEEAILKHIPFTLKFKNREGVPGTCYVDVKSIGSVRRIAKRMGYEVISIEKRI